MRCSGPSERMDSSKQAAISPLLRSPCMTRYPAAAATSTVISGVNKPPTPDAASSAAVKRWVSCAHFSCSRS